MTATATEKPKFDARVAAHKVRLADSPISGLRALAFLDNYGMCDMPSAPVDPALKAAARALLSETEQDPNIPSGLEPLT